MTQVHVDPHQGGGVVVLGGGPHRFADLGLLDDEFKGDHQAGRYADDQELQGGNIRVADMDLL